MLLDTRSRSPIQAAVLVSALMLVALGLATSTLAQQPAKPPEPADGAGATKFDPTFPEGEPAFDEEQVRKIVAQVVPLVEQVTERKFKKLPEVKLAGRPEVAAAVALDVGPQLRRLNPNLGVFEAGSTAIATGKAMAPALLGKYGFQKKVLYLLPRNFDNLLAATQIEPKHSESILKLIIAHELAHAMQDQQVDLLAVLGRIDTVEKSQAVNATIEGHAVFVQDAVGMKLQLDDAVVASGRLFSAGVVQLADPAQQLLARTVSRQFEVIYLGGKSFIAHHFAKGGNDRVWEILAAPPADTTMISRPERYSPQPLAELDYAALLKGIGEELAGDGVWRFTEARIGQQALSGVYANMREEDRKIVIQHMIAAQAVIAQGNGKMASVTLLDFEKPAVALQMLAAVEVMAQENIKKLQTSNTLKIEEFKLAEFPTDGNDGGHKLSFYTSSNLQPRMLQTFVRVVRGRYVIEFHDYEANLSNEKFRAIANKLLDRAAAAQAEFENASPKD